MKLFGLINNSPPEDSKTIQILTKWRDQIKPTLDPNIINEIENYVSNIPIEIPVDQPPLELNLNEYEKKKKFEAKPKANRRDWAYALAGAGSSMIGCCFEDQEHHMDVAFWCFLEAALIYLESDHLSNVAFYLLEKNALDDAQTLLCYSYFKDKTNYGTFKYFSSACSKW